ncbi:MAG: prolipoprotein diacylglyceryl transferase [Anaerolineae bacterium]|jgi:phosphatidylglycerol:prolipoprotein diacylglycerol transferase
MNPINPILFELGPFQVRWYGVLIMLGVGLGAYFSSRLAKKRGLDPDHVWNALILAVVMAILGARLYHVFSTPADCPPNATFPCGWPYYQDHFFEAFAVWKSGGFQGLGIYGAIVGGALGVVIYAWWKKLKPLVWLDMGAVGLAFGQFIGRWGNFINQELYGPPTGSEWFGIKINPDLPHQIPPDGRYDLRYHPTFLYESLWCLLVFLILYNVHARLPDKLRDGDVFLGYIILYPLGRFFIEFFRPDAWTIGGLATAQWIAIACIVGGAAVIVLRHIFWDRDKPTNGQRDAQEEPAGEKATA